MGACVVLATHSLEVAERFINRAILLVEGRLAGQWSRSQILDIRNDPANSLEASMAEAMD